MSFLVASWIYTRVEHLLVPSDSAQIKQNLAANCARKERNLILISVIDVTRLVVRFSPMK